MVVRSTGVKSGSDDPGGTRLKWRSDRSEPLAQPGPGGQCRSPRTDHAQRGHIGPRCAMKRPLDQLSESTVSANCWPPAQAPDAVFRQPTAATVATWPAFRVTFTPAAVGSTGVVAPCGTTASV